MVRISKTEYAALSQARIEAEEAKAKVEQLTQEVKGYYDQNNEFNEYFKAISQALNRNELPPMDVIDRNEIMRLYERSAPVQGVVNMIADNVGEVMRYLELKDKNGDTIETHPVLDILRRPNDRFGLRKFGQAWAVNKLLFGDAWVYAPDEVGKNLGKISSMYVIPSNRIVIKEGKVQPMEGIGIFGTSVTIDVDKIFESFDYNLDDKSFFGTSKVKAAALYLSVMDKGMRRQDTSLNNGGVSNIITPAKDTMGVMPKDADTVEKTFNNKKNVGKTLALRIPVDVHELGNAPVDLNILESHKEAVTALCFVFKIPVDLYYGQSKYENAKEAKKTIYEQNAIPMANEFGEDLLRYLKLDREGYTLEVNTDKIDVLKEKAGDTLDNLRKMCATLNEMREAYGYDAIDEDWANQPIIPMGTQFGNEDYDISEQ